MSKKARYCVIQMATEAIVLIGVVATTYCLSHNQWLGAIAGFLISVAGALLGNGTRKDYLYQQ